MRTFWGSIILELRWWSPAQRCVALSAGNLVPAIIQVTCVVPWNLVFEAQIHSLKVATWLFASMFNHDWRVQCLTIKSYYHFPLSTSHSWAQRKLRDPSRNGAESGIQQPPPRQQHCLLGGLVGREGGGPLNIRNWCPCKGWQFFFFLLWSF